MPEKQIEQRWRLAVKKKGGLALKLVTPGFTGITDRLNIMPGGRIIFAEIKYGKGVLSARQIIVHEVLRKLGCEVWVINEKNISEHIEKL